MSTANPQRRIAEAPSLDGLLSLVNADITRVNHTILQHVQSKNVPLIHEVATHIIASGGKRLRPALTIACASLCGYEGDRHINLAACVELIHTATLLHDDVVDESKLRRGLATANDLWGNKTSVLVGDFLLSRAFQLMVADGSLEVLTILSNTSAVISEGEVKQLMISNCPDAAEKDYIDVITAKTASLFAAATELGAVVSEQSQHQQALREFGLNLGITFQLTDDALDYIAEQDALGKTVGDDFREGKVTLPVILAYQMADDEEKAFFDRTIGELEQTEDDLSRAMEIMYKYKTIAHTIERAEYFAECAFKSLQTFEHSPIKSALEQTISFCIERTY